MFSTAAAAARRRLPSKSSLSRPRRRAPPSSSRRRRARRAPRATACGPRSSGLVRRRSSAGPRGRRRPTSLRPPGSWRCRPGRRRPHSSPAQPSSSSSSRLNFTTSTPGLERDLERCAAHVDDDGTSFARRSRTRRPNTSSGRIGASLRSRHDTHARAHRGADDRAVQLVDLVPVEHGDLGLDQTNDLVTATIVDVHGVGAARGGEPGVQAVGLDQRSQRRHPTRRRHTRTGAGDSPALHHASDPVPLAAGVQMHLGLLVDGVVELDVEQQRRSEDGDVTRLGSSRNRGTRRCVTVVGNALTGRRVRDARAARTRGGKRRRAEARSGSRRADPASPASVGLSVSFDSGGTNPTPAAASVARMPMSPAAVKISAIPVPRRCRTSRRSGRRRRRRS